MSLRTLQVLLVTAGVMCGLSASADPWKHESGNGYDHEDHSDRSHDHEHDRHHHMKWYREHYDRHGPPPWAPAYGYRRNQSDGRREDDDDRRDRDGAAVRFSAVTERIGISSGQCNRQAVGTIVGGIVGGVIGHNATDSRDKDLGTAAGALIGAIVGNQIGRSMDNADASCTNQVLERARDGQMVRWKNPDSGYRYSITPYKTYRRSDGRYCRDYVAVVVGSRSQKFSEVACRTDDGLWKRQ